MKWRAVLAVLAILGFSNFAPVAGFRHGRSDLEAQIEAFVADYNHLRYHESIANLTPADVYFGRGQTIQIERERIKRQTTATDGCGTAEILRRSGKSKPVVWTWQARQVLWLGDLDSNQD